MLSKEDKIESVPTGYTSVTPWIISPSSEQMIEFLTAVFDAEEIPNSRITHEDGRIIHVVVRLAGSMVMLFDARDGWGPSPAFLNIYVPDVEKAYHKALALGASSVTEITQLWFGEKVCRILDPSGNLFWINERTEALDFTNPEVGKRAATEDAIAGIAYIQQSLNEAMQLQKRFFDRV